MKVFKIRIIKSSIFILSIIIGFWLFNVSSKMVLKSRGYNATGGELFLLFFPVLFNFFLLKMEFIIKKAVREWNKNIENRRKERKNMEKALEEILAGAKWIDTSSQCEKLTRIDGKENKQGCIMVYTDGGGNYYKKQVRYNKALDGRIVPIKESVVKRNYKQTKPMPQCY